MLVICNGMLRSGSTLQYNLASEALEAVGHATRVGYLGGFRSPETKARLEEMREAESLYILKTHEPPLEPAFYTNRVTLLFTHRDLRDIAASIRKKWNKSFDEILSDLDAMIDIHVQIAALPRILIQPYDRLYHAMPQALEEIAAHLGTSLTPEIRARILQHNALETVSEHLAARRRNPLLTLLGRLSGRFRIDRKTELHSDHISETGGRDWDWQRLFGTDEKRALEDRMQHWQHRIGELGSETGMGATR